MPRDFLQRASAMERAMRNSPPPLDDVGEDVSFMLDEVVREFEPHTHPFIPENPAVADIFQGNRLLSARGKTHGSFADNAEVGQELRSLFRSRDGWVELTDVQAEALDMIAGKISRILAGSGGFADHWDDIAGYATLASQAITSQE